MLTFLHDESQPRGVTYRSPIGPNCRKRTREGDTGIRERVSENMEDFYGRERETLGKSSQKRKVEDLDFNLAGLVVSHPQGPKSVFGSHPYSGHRTDR